MVTEAEPRQVECPRCGERVAVETEERPSSFPFCSRKCKLLDLGKWLEGEHCISEDRGTPPEGGRGKPEKGENGRRG